MDTESAAKQLAELGHTTRLEVFRYLVRGGHSGVPVGEIQAALDVPGSTLSHHLTRLVSVGLVKQRREGRILYCTPQYDELNGLIGFLKDECCINERSVPASE
ncbi:MAG: metalloregulator ArsR/SmtB family transcription factor [Amphritea sp.]|nr:metalloregulator ArsR/SmtB family transcription factor [Amphritea sp.]